MDSGVISTNSSSLMYSRASSRESLRGGVSVRASSAPAERTLVSFLFLQDVDVQVALAAVLADDHADVDFGGGGYKELAALP